ncbi:titin-like isoform X2 [Pseudophryne corroboree]|uniref:titin-like isoform X2 n=1 Tax=Pseudophryne corroboree TaxID=495146 RepID=UPI0030817BE5
MENRPHLTMSTCFLIFQLLWLYSDLSEVQTTGRDSNFGSFLTIAGDKDWKATPGNNVTLKCIFKTETHIEMGLLTVQWLKDGVNKWFINKTCCGLNKLEKPLISEEALCRGDASLELRNVQIEDAGTYTCYIKYKSSEKSMNTTLLVEDLSDVQTTGKESNAGTFLAIAGDNIQKTTPGANVTLKCIFKTETPMEMGLLTVKWLKDGETKWFMNKTCCGLNKMKNPLISEEALSIGDASLELRNVQIEDASTYTCYIKYKSLENSKNTTLLVEDLSEAQTTVRERNSGAFLAIDGEHIQEARPGDDVTLKCTFKTETPIEMGLLTVQWLKDGEELWFMNKTCCDPNKLKKPLISEEALSIGDASLELRNVQREDAGTYTCYIKYKSLEKSTQITLLVKDDAPLQSSSGPELAEKFKTLKTVPIFGVVAVTGCLVVFILF